MKVEVAALLQARARRGRAGIPLMGADHQVDPIPVAELGGYIRAELDNPIPSLVAMDSQFHKCIRVGRIGP